MDHRVIGVVGASGGLGTSTLAVALAVRAARRSGVSACVDGTGWAGGLDVTACLEHVPGLRLGDLAGAAGELDGAALLRALPSQDGVAVLAPGAPRAEPRGAAAGDAGLGRADGALCAELVLRAVQAVANLCAVTVVDLGRPGWSLDGRVVQACTEVVLLAGTSARQLADAVAVAELLSGVESQAGLVLRAPRRDAVEPEDVAVRLDLPLVAVLRDDARVAADADRGRMPGTRPGGAPALVGERLLDWAELADEAEQRVSA